MKARAFTADAWAERSGMPVELVTLFLVGEGGLVSRGFAEQVDETSFRLTAAGHEVVRYLGGLDVDGGDRSRPARQKLMGIAA